MLPRKESRLLFLVISSIVFSTYVHGQDRFEHEFSVRTKRKRIPEKTITIRRAVDDIIQDGELNEQSWREADVISNFWQYFPLDTGRARSRTEARVTYDDKNLYVGIRSYDDMPGEYIVHSLRRDFSGRQNDNVTIYLDPFNDLTNGFLFGVTPLGVQKEGVISGGNDISTVWDNVWYSKVRTSEEWWTSEIRIPFKSFRYNDKNRFWNIQVHRMDVKRNEESTWTSVPRQFRPFSLTYGGMIRWDTLPPSSGRNISLIPYITGSAIKDFVSSTDTEWEGSAGLDAKISVSTSLNLDLTFNPDFSQTEVDRQVTNLSRFELFFPERRQFFLENSDLFAEFGFERSRPFFSRRIGLTAPIIGGARLSGKAGELWRLGFMNILTNTETVKDGNDVPAYNFSVAALQRRVFGNSNISAILVNKQAVNFDRDQNEEGFDFGDQSKRNLVYGLEYNLLSADNKWQGEFYLFTSNDLTNGMDGMSHGTELQYNTRHITASWLHEFMGRDFNAEVGFVPRKGFFRIGPEINYDFFPSSRVLNEHGPGIGFTLFTDRDGEVTDREIELGYNFSFLNTSRGWLRLNHSYIKLFDDFAPTRSTDTDSTFLPLPAGSNYEWYDFRIGYFSDSRKTFSFFQNISFGGFYNGTRLGISGSINYRIQPIINLSLNYSYDRIELPAPYGEASYWLIGPRFDITFSDKIFWTTYIQYSEQGDNLNINSRFQWRFKPVSDIYLIYTENYFPGNLDVKNRGIVFKISYWLNT